MAARTRHPIFHEVFVPIGLVFALSTLFAFILVKNLIGNHYQKNFEKRAINGLEIFHDRTSLAVRHYFETNIATIEQLANSMELKGYLTRGEGANALQMLRTQKEINKNFDILAIYDTTGKILYIAAATPEIEAAATGKDYSFRDYFINVKETGNTFVGETILGIASKKYQIPFATAIKSSSGELDYVISGLVYLDTLSEKTQFTNGLEYFSATVLDSTGNVLIQDGQEIAEPINLAQKDRVVDALLLGESEVVMEEINYKGEKVFAKGSLVDLGLDNGPLLVSFYPTAQFDADLEATDREVGRIYFGLAVANSILFIAVFWAIFHFWNFNERRK